MISNLSKTLRAAPIRQVPRATAFPLSRRFATEANNTEVIKKGESDVPVSTRATSDKPATVDHSHHNRRLSTQRQQQQHPVNQLFDSFFNDPFFQDPFSRHGFGLRPTSALPNWIERVRQPEFHGIQETDNGYEVEAEMAGVPKENVQVQVKNGVLTLSGQQKTEENKEGMRRYSRSNYHQSFALPDDADEASVKAKYSDGVLRVTMDKKAVDDDVKKIDVE
ncbi:Hsp [Planoprotostelium fungivorum]|uniref:Hsp n=1 Tax=Planoprotostelium fungivorum TaxID=1890364 RepID=A0A2P6MTA2_9EUKA|nr:Hsp [Planoprotostelium fungivorum]